MLTEAATVLSLLGELQFVNFRPLSPHLWLSNLVFGEGRQISNYLEIGFLGSYDAAYSDGYQPEFKSSRSELIFAYLAFHAGKSIERNHIAAVIWPDRKRPHGLASLRQCLIDIKAALGARAQDFLYVDRKTLRLQAGRVHSDIFCEDGSVVLCDLTPFLANLKGVSTTFDDWLHQARNSLSARQKIQVEQRLADLESSKYDTGSIIFECQTLLDFDPENQLASQLLMKAFDREGDHRAVDRVFQVLKQKLAETGRSVSQDTRAVYDHIFSVGLDPIKTPIAVGLECAHDVPLAVFRTKFDPKRNRAPLSEFSDLVVASLASISELKLVIPNHNHATDFGSRLSVTIELSMVVGEGANMFNLIAKSSEGLIVWQSSVDVANTADIPERKQCTYNLLRGMLGKVEGHFLDQISEIADKTSYGNYLLAKRGISSAIHVKDPRYIEKHFRRSIDLNPNLVISYFPYIQYICTGSYMNEVGVDLAPRLKLGLELCQRALSINPRHPGGHITMGWWSLRDSNIEAAYRYRDTAANLVLHDPALLNALGTMSVFLGEYGEAERYYSRAEQAFPQNFDLQYTDYGELYFLRREIDKALSYLGVLEQRSPGRSLFLKAACLGQLGRTSEAGAAVEQLSDWLEKRWVGESPYCVSLGFNWMYQFKCYKHDADREFLAQGIRAAGVEL